MFDPTRFNAATGELGNGRSACEMYPIGRSTVPLSRPLRHSGAAKAERTKKNSPQILNSGNGKFGEGATFDFTPALETRDGLLLAAFPVRLCGGSGW